MTLRHSLKSSFVVAVISGFAGLVMLLQDVVIASHFSTGGEADAYQLAISFPMLSLNVFSGGTLLAVLVPLLTQYAIQRRDINATLLIKKTRFALGWLLFTVCGIWALAYPHIVSQIATGFPAETRALSIHLLWLLVPVLFFSGLTGVDAALLNSRKRFVFISTLPTYLPAGVILGILLLEARLGIYAAALGLVCGGAVQWLVSRRLTASILHTLDRSVTSEIPSRKIVINYATAATSAALLSGILLTDSFMASTLPTGSSAAYGYAVRPVILLLAFITAVVGNVVLSFFSHMVANKNWEGLKKHALFWFCLLALGSFPIVAIWHTYAAELVALLYQRGAFSASDVAKVSAVQKIYLLQIPFFLIGVIGWRLLNSLNQHKALLVIAAACFLTNLVADLWLAPRFNLQGIAWGTNLAFALWAVLITLYLLKLHGNQASLAKHE